MSYKAIKNLAKQWRRKGGDKLGVWVKTNARLILRIQLAAELTNESNSSE